MHNAIRIACSLLGLACGASAAELTLLSHALPEASYTGHKTAPLAFDGQMKTAFSPGPVFPTWVMVDLGAERRVIKTMTFLEKSDTWYAYRIEVSVDGRSWTPFADQGGNREASEDPAYTDMGGATARYVKLTITDAPHRDKNPPWFWPVVREFQVYGVAVEAAAGAAR